MAPQTQLIALDWGSSSLRAWRLGAGGAVLDSRHNDSGASRAGTAAGAMHFEAALNGLIGDWLAAEPGVALAACGMVGSAHGWREVPYVPCPTDAAALAAGAAELRLRGGQRLFIVPGVCHRPHGTAPDVMRGEETQVLGLLATRPDLAAACTLVMPGTHSKWVRVHDGGIQAFHTAMTGEVYGLLREHSVLARLMPPPASTGAAFDTQAFVRGVHAAADTDPPDLLRLLFSARTLGLFGELAADALPDYLSGLLIGTEVRAGMQAVTAGPPLVLVGEHALCERYRLAVQACGRRAEIAGAGAATQGLWALALCGGWL